MGAEYRVLARKWRPQIFEDVLGQEHVVQTLKNAILHRRIAHAFIFSGPRGVGKTSVARIMAKALNCETGPTDTPCNACVNCSEITDGIALDVREIDGASNRGSTKSGSSGRTSGSLPRPAVTRSTSSTRSTCSPGRPSTPS